MPSRPTTCRLLVVAAGVAAALTRPPDATAQPTPQSPVVAIVRVKAPRFAPDFLIRRRMRATVDAYTRLPGLAYKAYTLSDDGYFGGAYLWTDRTSATQFFDSAWHARVIRERGVDGAVEIMDAPVVLDNEPIGFPSSRGGLTVVVVSLMPMPVGATRDQLVAGFRAAAPAFRTLPGLLRKYFVVTTDGRVGGVYVFATRYAAEQHFSDTWRMRTTATYGATPTLTWYRAPILTPTADPANHVNVTR
jgi:hypothetical protein